MYYIEKKKITQTWWAPVSSKFLPERLNNLRINVAVYFYPRGTRAFWETL